MGSVRQPSPPLVIAVRRRLHSLVEIATLLAGLLTITGYLGALWWPFDLAAHFRLQYAFTLPVAAGLAAALRRWKLGLVAAALALPNWLALAPLWWPAPPVRRDTPDTVHLVSFNVHTGNTRYADTLRYLEAQDADVVFLMEINQAWLDELAPLVARYPHILCTPRGDNFGSAFLTRLPVESLEELSLAPDDVPAAVARVNPDGKPLTIIALHALSPANAATIAQRDQQLAALAETVRALPTPALVIGDLNITPFSAHFQKLITRSGLRDSAPGRGLHPTWRGPLWGLQLPIDHALASPTLCVATRQVGPDLGSDHLPLEVHVNVR